MKSIKGASLIEYGFLVSLVAVLGIAGVQHLGETTKTAFTRVSDTLSDGFLGVDDTLSATEETGTGQSYPYTVALINPSFELGAGTSITGWTSANTHFRIDNGSTHNDNANAPRTGAGMVFPNISAGDQLTQSVDVSSLAADIDTGNYTATFAAWTITDVNDRGALNLLFYDQNNTLLNSAGTGWFADDNTTWLEKTLTQTIPANTRRIDVQFDSQRVGGSALQSYFDDASLVLSYTPPSLYPIALNVINPSFEDGTGTSITGWTSLNGHFKIATGSEHSDNANQARTGSNMVYPGVSTGDSLMQTINVSSYATQIDNDSLTANFIAWSITDTYEDGRLTITFYDDSMAQLSTSSTPWFSDDNTAFIEKILSAAIPVGTRNIEIQLDAALDGGGSVTQTYYDDVSLLLTD